MSLINLPPERQPLSDYRRGYLDGIMAASACMAGFVLVLTGFVWLLLRAHGV